MLISGNVQMFSFHVALDRQENIYLETDKKGNARKCWRTSGHWMINPCAPKILEGQRGAQFFTMEKTDKPLF